MQEADERIREAGLRVTKPRLAVLTVLDEARLSGEHLLVAQVADRVRSRFGRVSTQAVYDILEALSRVGVTRRVELPGSASRFESRVGDNHHHLTCRSCGLVVDVDCAAGSAPCLHPEDLHGFSLDEAEVVYWGLCPACLAGSTASAAPGAPGPAVPPADHHRATARSTDERTTA